MTVFIWGGISQFSWSLFGSVRYKIKAVDELIKQIENNTIEQKYYQRRIKKVLDKQVGWGALLFGAKSTKSRKLYNSYIKLLRSNQVNTEIKSNQIIAEIKEKLDQEEIDYYSNLFIDFNLLNNQVNKTIAIGDLDGSFGRMILVAIQAGKIKLNNEDAVNSLIKILKAEKKSANS